MARTMKEVLAQVVKELDDDEVRDEFEQLRNRKVTWADVKEAIAEAPPEDRAELRRLLADEGAPASVTGQNGGSGAGDDDTDAGTDADDDGDAGGGDGGRRRDPGRERRLRPGRKSGMAYDWFVDDDGNVVKSSTAIIYSGEDEPDEVEMLDDEDEWPDDAEVDDA